MFRTSASWELLTQTPLISTFTIHFFSSFFQKGYRISYLTQGCKDAAIRKLKPVLSLCTHSARVMTLQSFSSLAQTIIKSTHFALLLMHTGSAQAVTSGQQPGSTLIIRLPLREQTSGRKKAQHRIAEQGQLTFLAVVVAKYNWWWSSLKHSSRKQQYRSQ